MSNSRLRFRRRLPLALLIVAAASYSEAMSAETSTRLVAYQLWASDGQQGGKLPPRIEKLHAKLRKASDKKSFQLAGKPYLKVLKADQDVRLKLPGKYEARWRLDRNSETPKKPRGTVVRQVLVNPKGKESVVLLKRSPVIVDLRKIQKGKETLLLVVFFEKGYEK